MQFELCVAHHYDGMLTLHHLIFSECALWEMAYLRLLMLAHVVSATR